MSRIADPDTAKSPSPTPSREGLGDEPANFRQFLRQHRRVLLGLLAAGAVVAFVLAVLPQVAGFGTTLTRLRRGNKLWLLLGVGFEAMSLAGYIALLRTVFTCGGIRITWSASYQITLAGVVATKVVSAAGAGGLALTAWAMSEAGMRPRAVARRITAFEILLYVVYMGSLVIFGFGLRLGLFSGSAPFTLTVVPAGFAAGVIVLVLAFLFVPDDIERRLRNLSRISSRGKRVLQRLSTIPRTLRDGVQTAIALVRSRQLGLLGAVAYWGFDIAVLWASFRAFGAAPRPAVVVLAYFVGQLASAIPLPGGIGGVEGGMIGAFLAFGVNGSTAILAVLAYRAVSFWLPTLPGLFAYFQLRRTVTRWRQHSATTDGR
jgi:uncharacterized protein (TIRG00374 family)